MLRVNLTLDEFSDKMLTLMAMEQGTSKSEVVRRLVKAKAKNNYEILRGYCDLISKELNRE